MGVRVKDEEKREETQENHPSQDCKCLFGGEGLRVDTTRRSVRKLYIILVMKKITLLIVSLTQIIRFQIVLVLFGLVFLSS